MSLPFFAEDPYVQTCLCLCSNNTRGIVFKRTPQSMPIPYLSLSKYSKSLAMGHALTCLGPDLDDQIPWFSPYEPWLNHGRTSRGNDIRRTKKPRPRFGIPRGALAVAFHCFDTDMDGARGGQVRRRRGVGLVRHQQR